MTVLHRIVVCSLLPLHGTMIVNRIMFVKSLIPPRPTKPKILKSKFLWRNLPGPRPKFSQQKVGAEILSGVGRWSSETDQFVLPFFIRWVQFHFRISMANILSIPVKNLIKIVGVVFEVLRRVWKKFDEQPSLNLKFEIHLAPGRKFSLHKFGLKYPLGGALEQWDGDQKKNFF